MSIIIYRYYEPGDEGEIVSLWNRCLNRDPVTETRFRRLVLLDPNFQEQGLRVAEAEGRLVGCFYAVRRRLPMSGTELETDRGWCPFFFVDPAYRRQGVGSRLLAEAAGFLRQEKRKRLIFSGYAPNYIVPGIDREAYPEAAAFLAKTGFERLHASVAMDYSMVQLEIPDDVRRLKEQRQQEGYTFRTAQDSDIVELIRFAAESFNPDWGRAIREGLMQQLQLSQILVARQCGRLIGFCLHGSYEGIRERFGPFGVDESQRGKGIGKILLYDCLWLMRSQGLHHAWFLWTGEQSAAGQLYLKAGFRITRRFETLSLPL
ncbi:Acetyltransferase (GNAT) family protein [Paenibacillus sp. UNCCL117]|uniref:GNAT family N-acetyltransferase n=1 Tax=unclassified Paenibacillus TaxID=185978 RepID=UPI000882F2C4|nr:MULTISPECIES: GNAT family N-acetyltransferase [unclassified Paenibacillus]SDC91774.1 Acetyltransferase (GNAT) family protein [Paenibacillus sp. cl123]SFW29163.1 Acetyltransferase (GNAT) family protein [Paenibacillus sp. UNCCL117]